MKYVHLILSSLLLLASSLTFSADDKNWYLGAAVGNSALDITTANTNALSVSDDSDNGTKIFFGKTIDKRFSLEGFYTNLGDLTLTTPTGNQALEYSSKGIALTAKFPLSGKLSGILAGGLNQVKIDTDVIIADKTDSGLYSGAALDYAISNGLSARLGHDSYSKDAKFTYLAINKTFGVASDPRKAKKAAAKKAAAKKARAQRAADKKAAAKKAASKKAKAEKAKADKLAASKAAAAKAKADKAEAKKSDASKAADKKAAAAKAKADKAKKIAAAKAAKEADKKAKSAEAKAKKAPKESKEDKLAAKKAAAKTKADALAAKKATAAEAKAAKAKMKAEALAAKKAAALQAKADKVKKAAAAKAAKEAAKKAKKRKVVALSNISFKVNSAELTRDAKKALNSMVSKVKKLTKKNRVEVGAHSDSTGQIAYNIDLTNRRAQAVLEYLVSKGINATKLTAKGYGKSQPIATNDTAEGRATNRRVELKKVK